MPKNRLLRASILFMPLFLAPSLAGQSASPLHNSRYTLRVDTSGTVEVKSHEHMARFEPVFAVVIADKDPGLLLTKDKETAFKVPTWKSPSGSGTTTDFFKVGEVVSVRAAHTTVHGNTVQWTFGLQPRFQIEADMVLGAGTVDPVIHLHFKALKPGWYSAGYSGAPQTDPGNVSWLWQPLVWQERRFPSQSFLSIESMCSLPATFVQTNGYTVGVTVDPSEAPFRLPTLQNSRFGVVLRNEAGKAQPMAFAPVLGSSNSHLESGANTELTLRVFVQDGDWYASFKHIAQDIFDFHDYRHNGPASLNTTLDNMVDFAMNDAYSGWDEDLKAFDYKTDVAGSVKLVSALHPLSVAVIRDDQEIYRRRALPMTEYIMSRQKYLYSVSEGIKGQNASHLMKGPSAEVSELSALYLMSQNRSPVFRYYANLESKTARRLNLNMMSNGDTFQDMLALYRMTGDQQYLNQARTKADSYIASRINATQQDFSDVHVATGGQFWSDFAPKWRDLFELYEATQDKRYLDAAAAGAREYAQYVWLQPTVPDHDVLVNPGGLTPQNYTGKLPDPKPIPSPQQMVPAWRVSQVGLTPEASTTYTSAPGIFLTQYASYMLRLSQYTGDKLLHDIARSAVVGRYENFPGYDTFGAYTTTYQRPDYPLRPWEQLTYNQIYYNHVWPQIALLYDYLISDSFVRSEGKVSFPSRYAPSYAYLQSKVYGDRPGTIYGEDNVRLWMPRSLLLTDQTETNYIAGYSQNTLYLVLMNQSKNNLPVHLTLDPNVVPLDALHTYRVRSWINNHPSAATTMRNGKISTSVRGSGLTVLAIDDLKITSHFQSEYFDKNAAALSDESFKTSDTPFGPMHSMILSMGKSLGTAYVWLEATEKQLSSASLSYKVGDRWETVTDSHYPYEFSLPLKDGSDFEFRVDGIRADGAVVHSDDMHLHR